METIERDLTTPTGIHKEVKRLLLKVKGRHPSVTLHISQHGPSLYVDHDMCAPGKIGEIACVTGDTFAEMFDKAEQAIANYAPAQRNATIRKMALAIIELIDEHTECTRTMLRSQGFIQSDIDAYSAGACARAGEMCGNTPFSVKDK